MKSYRIYLAVILLVLASLACQVLGGGSDNTPAAPPANDTGGEGGSQPTAVNSQDNDSGNTTIDTDFAMTPDAYNVMQSGGSLIFYTKLSLEDAMKFYRDTYTSKGYTERTINTVVTNGNFSIVFDGDPSGKALVVQSVDLGDGSRTISVRLE